MSNKHFRLELLWENIVGIVFAVLVLVGVVLSAFFVFDTSQESAKKKSTPTLVPENTLTATSVNNADIEKLYQQKRKELADKKAAERAEKKRMEEEQQRIAAEKERLDALAKQKREAAAAEEQRIKREKAALEKQKQQAEAAAKKAEEQKKQAEAAAKKAVEEKRKAEAARKKVEAEKAKAEKAKAEKAKAEKAKAEKAKAEKAKAEKAKAEKAKAEKAKAEKEAREKAEAEKKRLEEAARKKAADEEKARIANELAADIAAREEEDLRKQAISRYGQAIADKVKGRWVIPAKLPQGLSARLQIQTVRNGQVKAVKIVRSSGNVAFDTSAIQAVKLSSPLPLPKKQEWAEEFATINLDFP